MTSQNCAECGTRAEPGQSFCDACGAVLSWSEPAATRTASARGGAGRERTTAPPAGVTPAADPEPAPSKEPGPPPPAPAAARDTRPEPVLAPPPPEEDDDTIPNLRLRPAGTDGRTSGTDGTSGADRTDGTIGTGGTDRSPDRPGGDAAPETSRARELLVPVADPSAPAEPQPAIAPALPGRPHASRPQVRRPTPQPGVPGGPPCPWCGTPNRPDRHFCVQCAMPLSGEDGAPGPRPWWRRIFDRGREAPWAGERPRLRRSFGYVMRWVVWSLVIVLLVVAATRIPDAVRATRDHFARRAAVSPDSFRASRSFPDHEPQLAFDKLSDTWWGPGVSQSGQGEWIEARFDTPTRLLDVIITPGVSTRADQLSEQAQPHRLEARITKADGTVETREVVLDQGPGGQRRSFRAEDVTRVRFTLQSAHGAADDKQVAIAEIEFFGPSSGGS
ncbi:zinc ribbon domain-containing protein [Streptomyces sp. 7-21]|uniref:NADase-type glycan-binding domain-containing protein n=1 Tax=Streptomyces sp. 7-21 TaxID=2802283 RepID=UPI00191D0CB4|nr:zinc ribbon domain-containing protein [Streptomyces sp. 7-21]MBL1068011.1 zinc ribbon domain-containing protein [Streptomyces sp. 7-21]